MSYSGSFADTIGSKLMNSCFHISAGMYHSKVIPVKPEGVILTSKYDTEYVHLLLPWSCRP